jgi:hypothetical protein
MDTKEEKIYPPIMRMDAKCPWSAATCRRFESAAVSAHSKFCPLFAIICVIRG